MHHTQQSTLDLRIMRVYWRVRENRILWSSYESVTRRNFTPRKAGERKQPHRRAQKRTQIRHSQGHTHTLRNFNKELEEGRLTNSSAQQSPPAKTQLSSHRQQTPHLPTSPQKTTNCAFTIIPGDGTDATYAVACGSRARKRVSVRRGVATYLSKTQRQL